MGRTAIVAPSHTVHLWQERMRHRNSMTCWVMPAFAPWDRGALSWNNSASGETLFLGRSAASGTSSITYDAKRWPPINSNYAGTHWDGSPRSLGWWLCKKNTASCERSRRLKRVLHQWHGRPGRPRFRPKKSSGLWIEEGAGAPIHPGAHSLQDGGDQRRHGTYYLEAHHQHSGVCGMADQDGQCSQIRKHPVPLICPKFTFTGHAWWQPQLAWWTRLSAHPSFEAIDYLIPTISKDGMGFIAIGRDRPTVSWGGLAPHFLDLGFAQLPNLHSWLCLSTWNFPGPEEIPGWQSP